MIRAFKKVLDHGAYVNGPEVVELEQTLAKYVGTKHCLTIANGTDALWVPLMALGIGQGDEVITTAFSFIATAETIVLAGAKPIYVDIDPKTFNIDPSKIEAAITPRTKAIMPVSLYGQMPDMDKINAIAKKHNLHVIEDAAQSFGARYKDQRSGSMTIATGTSFSRQNLWAATATAERSSQTTILLSKSSKKFANTAPSLATITLAWASMAAWTLFNVRFFYPRWKDTTGSWINVSA